MSLTLLVPFYQTARQEMKHPGDAYSARLIENTVKTNPMSAEKWSMDPATPITVTVGLLEKLGKLYLTYTL